MNFVAADYAGAVEGADTVANVRDDEMLAGRPDPGGESLGDTFDPWQALAQVGAQFVTALAAANDRDASAHPWIERDPGSGAQSLKVPLPSPETVRQLANALSALADSMRGKFG